MTAALTANRRRAARAPAAAAAAAVALLILAAASQPAAACEKNCRRAFIGPVFQWYAPRIHKAYDVLANTVALDLHDIVANEADCNPYWYGDYFGSMSAVTAAAATVSRLARAWEQAALAPSREDFVIRQIFGGGNPDPAQTIRGGGCCECCTGNNCRSCPGGRCDDRSRIPDILAEFRSGNKICGSEYAAKTHMNMVLNESQRWALATDVDWYATRIVDAVRPHNFSQTVLDELKVAADAAVLRFKNAYVHLSDGLQSSVGPALADYFICVDHRKDQRNPPPGEKNHYEVCRNYPASGFIPPAPDMSGGAEIDETVDGFFVKGSVAKKPEPVAAGDAAPTELPAANVPTEATPAGDPTEATPAGVPTEATPAGVPTEATPAGVPAEATPAGVPTEATPAGVPAEITPADVPEAQGEEEEVVDANDEVEGTGQPANTTTQASADVVPASRNQSSHNHSAIVDVYAEKSAAAAAAGTVVVIAAAPAVAAAAMVLSNVYV